MTRTLIRTCRCAPRLLCLAGTLVFLAVPAPAQSLRDPTLAPSDARQNTPSLGGPSGNTQSPAMSVLVRDGRPYLMVGTRLYAQGQMLGQARIERISETQLTLREGGVQRTVPLFKGIVRRAAVAPVAHIECGATQLPAAKPATKTKTAKAGAAAKALPAVAPCAEVQP